MWKNVISFTLSFVLLSIGMIAVHFGWVKYGIALFIGIPIFIGYFLIDKKYKESVKGVVSAIIVFSLFAYLTNLEGVICILAAMPLILLFILIGFIIKNLIKIKGNNYSKKDILDDEEINKSKLILPFLLFFLLGFIENFIIDNTHEIVEVKTSILLDYSNIQVYETIKSVDTLDAEKPFLMHIDLPIPQKCILEEEKVGGLRTCYFEGGQIVEKITALEKGKLLQMDVIDYQLKGRKWLGFKEAIYTFEIVDNNHSVMTRYTTYTSKLYPRWYWKPIEKWGIQQEHQYVINNLIKDLKNKSMFKNLSQ